MSYLDTIASKKIGVLGLGVSGLACVSFLMKFRLQPFVMDRNLASKGVNQVKAKWPEIAVYQSGDELMFGADMLIVSPGIALSSPEMVEAKKRGIEIIGDVELFARINQKPVIAITGSNGKSTVTKLVTELLQNAGLHAVYGGNIGVPVLDLMAKPFDIAVLELSSFQLETTDSLNCKSATILNAVEDHMDRYESFNGYVGAKQKIFANSDIAVYNRADKQTKPKGDDLKQCSFGLEQPQNSNVGLKDDYFVVGNQQVCPVDSLKLVGQHNILNALAAIALVKPFDVSNAVIEQTLKQFNGLPHRCELIEGTGNVKWINDSKATNVGATVAALQGIKPLCKGKLILLAGGVGKDADFEPLAQALNEHVDHLITFGQDGDQIAGLIENAQQVASLDEAVKTAHALAANDDCVLLSPACASFDMFANFEARGEQFMALAREACDVS